LAKSRFNFVLVVKAIILWLIDHTLNNSALTSHAKNLKGDVIDMETPIKQTDTAHVKSKKNQKPIILQAGKITFIVTPVYSENSGKTIHESLFTLMKKEYDKH